MSNAKNLATFLQSGGSIAGDANFDSNTLFVDASANAVGVGTSSPSGAFTSAGGRSFFFSGDLYGIGIAQSSGQANYAYLGSDASGNLQVSDTQGNQIATFTQDNNVGIGTSSPSGLAHVYNGMLQVGSKTGDTSIQQNANAIRIAAVPNSSTEWGGLQWYREFSDVIGAEIIASRPSSAETDTDLIFKTSTNSSNAVDVGRFTHDGNLLVGKTSSSFSVAGIGLMANDQIFATATSDNSLALNRLSTDGDIAKFYKDGSTVGSIGVEGGDNFYITDNNNTGLNMKSGLIIPCNTNGSTRDNAIDLGASGGRFNDLYLGGSAIIKGDSPTGDGGNIVLQVDASNATDRTGIIRSGNNVASTTSAISFETVGGNQNGEMRFYTRNGSTVQERMRIASNGDVTITGDSNAGYLGVIQAYTGTTSGAANLHILSSGVFLRSTSSGRYKTGVEDAEMSYAQELYNLRPVYYKSLGTFDDPNHSHWGFIAEEVAEIDPRLCLFKTTEPELDDDGNIQRDDTGNIIETTLSEPVVEGVQYDRMIPLLLMLLKEQKERIETLEAKVTALENA